MITDLRYRLNNVSAAFAGVLSLVVALMCSNVTVARGGYGGVLLVAMACGTLAVCCLAVPFVRGPLAWRLTAVVLALPVLFVVADFLRRAPFVFGGDHER
jgi:hypothetical protein